MFYCFQKEFYTEYNEVMSIWLQYTIVTLSLTREQWYFYSDLLKEVTSIHFVKINTFLDSHQQVLLQSSVLCPDNWASGELGVNNCLINPFMTEFN